MLKPLPNDLRKWIVEAQLRGDAKDKIADEKSKSKHSNTLISQYDFSLCLYS
jgi:hypothetical protein